MMKIIFSTIYTIPAALSFDSIQFFCYFCILRKNRKQLQSQLFPVSVSGVLILPITSSHRPSVCFISDSSGGLTASHPLSDFRTCSSDHSCVPDQPSEINKSPRSPSLLILWKNRSHLKTASPSSLSEYGNPHCCRLWNSDYL